MIKKCLLLVSLLSVISLCSCQQKKKSYTPGDSLTITSIEMVDEYGDSTLIQFHDYDILVDSGSEKDANHVNSVLNAKVTDKTIDLLVVTHPHGDHIGGILNNALQGFKVNKIVDYGYTYDTNGNDKIDNSAYVQQYVNKKGALVTAGATYRGVKEELKDNEVLTIDKDNDLSIRWLKNDYYYGQSEVFPNSNAPTENPNATSVSFVLEYKYWNIIMCGDADSSFTEASIVKNHKDLFKDTKKRVLLKGTHHCSSSSMGNSFLDWANPEMIFTSSAMVDSICAPNEVALGSAEGQLNHPNKSTVRRIKQKTTNFYWNGINGDLTFVTDGVNDMSVSGVGRTKNYLKKGTADVVDASTEKNVKFFDSEFYKYF